MIPSKNEFNEFDPEFDPDEFSVDDIYDDEADDPLMFEGEELDGFQPFDPDEDSEVDDDTREY